MNPLIFIMYVDLMFDEKFKKRFWTKVKKLSSSECWPWMAAKNSRGQGFFRVHYGRKMDMAYRVSWILQHGQMIPGGMEIMHTCDNPTCCNPAHLRVGTHAENMRDMIQKGRDRKRTKLSDSEIEEIRASTLAQRKLAAMFGISQCHVSDIKSGKRRKHLKSPNLLKSDG